MKDPVQGLSSGLVETSRAKTGWAMATAVAAVEAARKLRRFMRVMRSPPGDCEFGRDPKAPGPRRRINGP